MSPQQYYEVVIGLDRALFVFHECEATLDDADRELVNRLAELRSEIVRVGTRHPFPTVISGDASDPELTRAPWK